MGGQLVQQEEGLNLKQVAAELGVHYMTAYRYVRTGRLAAEKVGAGWVVTPSALRSFAAESEPSPGEVDWPERLATTLTAGDEPAAWRVLQQALAGGHSPADCYLDILGPALRLISSPHPEHHGAREYLATATATRLVARLGGQFRRPGRALGTIVFGAPLGEHHGLPIAIVADLVRLDGFTCLELGADVPPEAFSDAAAHAHQLIAVGIGVTTAANIDAVRTTIAAVNEAAPGTPVLLGGQAVLNAEIAELAGATHWAHDGATARAILTELGDAARNGRRASTTVRSQTTPG